MIELNRVEFGNLHTIVAEKEKLHNIRAHEHAGPRDIAIYIFLSEGDIL